MIWSSNGTILVFDSLNKSLITEIPANQSNSPALSKELLHSFSEFSIDNLNEQQVASKYSLSYKSDKTKKRLFEFLNIVMLSAAQEDIRISLLKLIKENNEEDKKVMEIVELCETLMIKDEDDLKLLFQKNGGNWDEIGYKIFQIYDKYKDNIKRFRNEFKKSIEDLIDDENTEYDKKTLNFLIGEKIICNNWFDNLILNNIITQEISREDILEMINSKEITYEDDEIYRLLKNDRDVIITIQNLVENDSLFMFLYTHLLLKSNLFISRKVFSNFESNLYQLLDETTSLLDETTLFYLPILLWSSYDLFVEKGMNEFQVNLICLVRKIYPSFQGLFLDTKLKKFFGDSSKYYDFIKEINNTHFTINGLPIKQPLSIQEICSNEDIFINFLNQQYSKYPRQEQIDFLNEQNVQEMIQNPDFSYKRIQENVLYTLLETSTTISSSDISSIIQQWIFSYISEHGAFPSFPTY